MGLHGTPDSARTAWVRGSGVSGVPSERERCSLGAHSITARFAPSTMGSLTDLVRALAKSLDDIEREASTITAAGIGGRSHLVVMQLAEASSDVVTAGR